MEPPVVSIKKGKIKMKGKFVFWSLFLFMPIISIGQFHVDTLRIKGYYLVCKLKQEQNYPRMTRINDSTTRIEFLSDVHREESFIPLDSISYYKSLSYWLHHFFDSTDNVFVSCSECDAECLMPKQFRGVNKVLDTCIFPMLKSTMLYETTDINDAEVFNIYYIDADWARIPVNKDSVESSNVPGKIAERCIKSNVQWYNVYYCIKYYNFEDYPIISDDCIQVWDKMSDK